MARHLTSLALVLGITLAGCGSDDSSGGGGKGGSGGGGGMAGSGGTAGDSGTPVDGLLELPCTDAIADVYGPHPTLTSAKGTILSCAPDGYLTKEELLAQAKANGYAGADFVSGAHVYRVAYRTERGDTASSPGFSTAIVYLPDTPVADSAPLVASAHPTVGQGKNCLISQDATLGGGDTRAQFVPIAGAGYPVITSDYAGYADFGSAGNPPSGWMVPSDAPKSLLDSVHALRSMMPKHAAQEVVLTGHSQGGHVALSALSLAGSYGIDGKLSGVVAYAPWWMSNYLFGVGIFLSASIEIKSSLFETSAGIWHYYSAGELADGQGHGVDIFAPAKQAAVKSFFEDGCIGDTDPLKSMGTYLSELFDPDFVKAVGAPATSGTACPGDGSKVDELCKKWVPRLEAGRPHLTGTAKDVPVLFMWGDKDTTISPGYATCGVDRLNADGAKLETCVLPGATHNTIVRQGAEHVNSWISARTLGSAEPAKCPSDFTFTTDAGGAKLASVPDSKGGMTGCSFPPSNTSD